LNIDDRIGEAGGSDMFHGKSRVVRVSTRRITLVDGTCWRMDGYAWGSTSERGIGRPHARRIERLETTP